jgi:hypothetical protein
MFLPEIQSQLVGYEPTPHSALNLSLNFSPKPYMVWPGGSTLPVPAEFVAVGFKELRILELRHA